MQDITVKLILGNLLCISHNSKAQTNPAKIFINKKFPVPAMFFNNGLASVTIPLLIADHVRIPSALSIATSKGIRNFIQPRYPNLFRDNIYFLSLPKKKPTLSKVGFFLLLQSRCRIG
jgi:hypothetical protein